MSQLVQLNSSVLAAVTSRTGYINARKEADKLALEHDLTVADMPMAIQAMTNHPEVREAIRPFWVDTITGEYHGQRKGDRSYETWHSVGSLATTAGLEKRFFFKAGDHDFMLISDEEWVAVGKGSYNNETVVRVHLEDAKKGNVPALGTPYTIFVKVDKDRPKINGRGQLNYDTFMQDDRVLMITGSPEGREALAKMLFGRGEDGGGYSTIGSYHRINEVGFDAKAKGRLAYLDIHSHGLNGGKGIYHDRCFVVVDVEGERSEPKNERSTSELVVAPTLEETLAIGLHRKIG
ncbi:hypothetical protein HYU19_01200 [Candidatus Woesearchaeota archaeon]|nr:hypothetical protein [Candidatus Woesearchaeota archaeon]